MDLFKAILLRHCYRGSFRQDSIPREDLREIVQAGLMAPSGKNLQTTRFVIVDRQDVLCQIAAICPVNQAVMEMRAMIACIVDREPDLLADGPSFQVEDCATAVDHMLLAATALSYATVWIDGALRVENRADRIGQLLGVPQAKVVRIILPLGNPAEPYQGPVKMSFEERAWFDRYGG